MPKKFKDIQYHKNHYRKIINVSEINGSKHLQSSQSSEVIKHGRLQLLQKVVSHLPKIIIKWSKYFYINEIRLVLHA